MANLNETQFKLNEASIVQSATLEYQKILRAGLDKTKNRLEAIY